MVMIVTMMVVAHYDHWPGSWLIMIMVLQLFMIVMVRRQVVVHDDRGPEEGGCL